MSTVTVDEYYDYRNPPYEHTLSIVSPSGQDVRVAYRTYVKCRHDCDTEPKDERPIVETEDGTRYAALEGVDYSNYGWTYVRQGQILQEARGFWIPSSMTERIQKKQEEGDQVCIII